MKALTDILRQGGIAGLKMGNQFGYLMPFKPESMEKAQELFPAETFEQSYILISEIGQLYDYTNQIPEIAWDIAEFEEHPLVIEYPTLALKEPLNTSLSLLPRIMLVKHPELQKALYNYGKGVLFLKSSEGSEKADGLEGVDYVLTLDPDSFNIFKPKIIRLKMDGEIKFL